MIDDCYNANPMSMRAALDDLATTAQPVGARTRAILGDMLELGPDASRYHADIGRHAGEVGIDVLVTVGPLAQAMAAGFPREVHAVADADAAAALVPGAGRGRRHGSRQGLARRRPRARLSGAVGGSDVLMGPVSSGRVLIAGTASLLICLFLSPKFIEFLRHREFGQNIREEGPQGHQTKAGTPTMGGIIIFAAFAVPFLILSSRSWQSMGVLVGALACALLGFADDYTKIVKRRSLGLRARTKLVVTIVISLGLWWVATQKAAPVLNRQAPVRRRQRRPRPAVSRVHLPRRGRHDQRRQPDRRPRRPGRGLRGDRASGLHRDHVHHARQRDLAMLAGCLVGACIGFLWFNSFPASIFMGDTGSLGLGGAIAGLAIMTNTEVLLLPARAGSS